MKRSNDNGNQSYDNIKKARCNPHHGSGNISLERVAPLRLKQPTNTFTNSYQKDVVNSNSVTNIICRTVYLGNLPSNIEAYKLINQIKFGPLESVKLIPDKACAFISFMNTAIAKKFYEEAMTKKNFYKGKELKVGWGKPSAVPEDVQLAVNENNASRNVFLENLDHSFTENILHRSLAEYGSIDTLRIDKRKNIGLVHFLNISSAIRAVKLLPSRYAYKNVKVNYAKDRCEISMRNSLRFGKNITMKHGMETHNPYFNVISTHNPYFDAILTHKHYLNGSTLFNKGYDPNNNQHALPAEIVAKVINNVGNRSIYLGNIHPETKNEEICNVIRGGILQHVQHIPEQYVAFVTFVDSNAAASFLFLVQNVGVIVKNRRLKADWGKNPGPLPEHIEYAVNTWHASRNIFIRKLGEEVTEEKLYKDFGEYGELESVYIVKEKKTGYVNFMSIDSAISAMEHVRGKGYKDIHYGKDRCGSTK